MRVTTGGLWALGLVAWMGMAGSAQAEPAAGGGVVAQGTDPAPAPGPAPAPTDPANPMPALPNLDQPTADTPPEATPALPTPDQVAAEVTPTTAPSASGPAPSPLPIRMTVMWYHYLGEGTFAWDRHVRNPYYAWWISLRGRAQLPYNFALSYRQDINFELTNSDVDTYARQAQLSDTRLGLSYSGLRLPEVGLSASLYTGVRLPLSTVSRYRHQLGSAEFVTGLDWSKWGVFLSGAAFGVMHVRPSGKPTLKNSWAASWFGDSNESQGYTDRSGNYVPTFKCIARAADIATGGCPATGAANGSLATLIMFATVGYDLSAMFEIPLSVSATAATIHSFSSYFGPDDQYTSDYGRIGVARTDLTWALLTVAWQATDNLSIDLGTSSQQTLMDQSNRYVRFPFWDVPYWDWRRMGSHSGADNNSTLYLGFTASI